MLSNTYRWRSLTFVSIRFISSIHVDFQMRELIKQERYRDALNLFHRQSMSISDVSINLALKASTKLFDYESGERLYQQYFSKSLTNPFLQTSFIHFYMQNHRVDRAEQIFSSIKTKNVYVLGAMWKGYLSNGFYEKVLHHYQQLSIKPDPVLLTIVLSACTRLATDKAIHVANSILQRYINDKSFSQHRSFFNSTLDMLMKFGRIDQAEKLFTERIHQRDDTTFAVMIHGYNINGQTKKCLDMFEFIRQSKIKITDAIAVPLISACSQIGLISICRLVSAHIPLTSKTDQRVKNVLIDMWGKAGDIDRSKDIFQSIEKQNIFTYSSMINAFGRNGMGSEAIELYRQIPSSLHDSTSHICVLNACSHAGLIDEAEQIFQSIERKTEKIVTTMIDCLARMSFFDRAEKLIEEFERTNSPYIIMYMTMLSAARNHHQISLSERISRRMRSLFPEEKSTLNSAAVLLANTYLAVGNDEQAESIRSDRLKRFGKKIQIGIAWTEVNGEFVEFRAHDRLHPRSDEIYAELNRISSELEQVGYQFDASWITRPLKEGETIQSVLCGHSEKLALAFNMIQQPRPSFIQIGKNLRICGDCHGAMKLIARLRQCDIVIRDANRIHHFNKNGLCSCMDHF